MRFELFSGHRWVCNGARIYIRTGIIAYRTYKTVSVTSKCTTLINANYYFIPNQKLPFVNAWECWTSKTLWYHGATENARHEFAAPTAARAEIARRENARNAIVLNTECCLCLSVAEQECMSRQERAPDFCVFTSLTVMTWTIISWCCLSVTNVCLAFTQVVLSVCCAVNCVALII